MSNINFNKLVWFIGVVEDVNDPISAGRVRVRCFDIHPPYGDEVPTEALPWSIPINGTYGSLYKIPEIAEWVFGFFLDGRDAQHPFLLGTIPGVNTALPAGVPNTAASLSNFGSPTSNFPMVNNSSITAASSLASFAKDAQGLSPGGTGTVLQEIAAALQLTPSNTPTLIGSAFGSLAGIVGQINDYIKGSSESVLKFGQNSIPPQLSGIDVELTPLIIQEFARKTTDLGGSNGGFDEPSPAFGGAVSKNSVWQAGYGKSYIEVNGTDESEHISLVHTSGSHVQIDSNGNVKIRSLHDTYSGSDGHSRENIGGKKEVYVEGDFTINVGGNANFNVTGNFNIDCNDFNVTARGKLGLNTAEGVDIRGSRVGIHAKDDNLDIYASNKIKIFSGGVMSTITNGYQLQTVDYDLKSSGDARLEASKISIKGSTVAIDDIIQMANGLSDAAAAPEDVAVVPYFENEPGPKNTLPATGKAISTPEGGYAYSDDTVA